ncbi:MAG TPA: four-carbon acid sugar kinase family protein [Chitinophagaceae bacterium]|nr:four-carbon acid sugar kinase family protein [Chitinophagaceae bacterium]
MPGEAKKKKVVVVADDFTGATDAGVQFRKGGFAVNVIIDVQELKTGLENSEVLVVDLESRFDTAEVAYAKCFEVGRLLYETGETLVYKKMDSTLRGNIGAEIDGLMAGLRVGVALFAPAIPVNGRTTREGVVYVHGVRLEETEFAADPRTPVRFSRIADIVSLQTTRRVSEVKTAMLPAGETIDKIILEEIGSGAEILIFDSVLEKDLQQVAEAIGRLTELPLLIVGSAGLALHLPNLPFIQNNRFIFVFSGSVSEKSREQVSHTVSEGGCGLFFLDGNELLSGSVNPEMIMASVQLSIVAGTRRFIFTSALSRKDVDSVFQLAAALEISVSEASEKMASGIGNLAALLINKFQPGAVLLTGGETAIKTVQALRASGIIIEGEILPGIQLGTLTGRPVKTVVATKPGGFGPPDAISKTFIFFKV